MTTLPGRPKGGMTMTAARSKWVFWAGVALGVVWLPLSVSAGGKWYHWLAFASFLGWVLLFFRSSGSSDL